MIHTKNCWTFQIYASCGQFTPSERAWGEGDKHAGTRGWITWCHQVEIPNSPKKLGAETVHDCVLHVAEVQWWIWEQVPSLHELPSLWICLPWLWIICQVEVSWLCNSSWGTSVIGNDRGVSWLWTMRVFLSIWMNDEINMEIKSR
jgi:hypothetical protein